MIEQVVVPVDFSRESDRAILTATALASWAHVDVELARVALAEVELGPRRLLVRSGPDGDHRPLDGLDVPALAGDAAPHQTRENALHQVRSSKHVGDGQAERGRRLIGIAVQPG